MLTDRYRRLVAELSELDGRRADGTWQIGQRYDEELAAATAAVADAAWRVRTAAALVSQVDAAAVRTWRALAVRLGPWQGRRLGPLAPVPSCSTVDGTAAGLPVGSTVDTEPPGAGAGPDRPGDPVPPARERARDALHRAAALAGALHPPYQPMPRGVVAAFPAVGTLAAGALAVPAHAAVVALAGNVAGTVLAQLLVFLAPFAGVPVVVAWTRRRFGTGPQVAGVALTVLGGMVACWAVTLGAA